VDIRFEIAVTDSEVSAVDLSLSDDQHQQITKTGEIPDLDAHAHTSESKAYIAAHMSGIL